MAQDSNPEDQDSLRRNTKNGIENIGSIRKRIALLEEKGIPEQYDEFEVMRDEIHYLLDRLLLQDKIEFESSHLIRNKLKRVSELFLEMEEVGHYHDDPDGEKLNYHKEKQDSKLHVVQLMLSQIFPKLKEVI